MKSDADGKFPKKAGRGRPRKPPGSDMVPRNMSLTPQDEEALRLLSGRIQLYHTYTLGYPPEGFSVSWAIRALIRYADAETTNWKYQDPSLILKKLVEHGMRDPREEPATIPPTEHVPKKVSGPTKRSRTRIVLDDLEPPQAAPEGVKSEVKT